MLERVHRMKGKNSLNKVEEHLSKIETDFAFNLKIMKLKFRKVNC